MLFSWTNGPVTLLARSTLLLTLLLSLSFWKGSFRCALLSRLLNSTTQQYWWQTMGTLSIPGPIPLRMDVRLLLHLRLHLLRIHLLHPVRMLEPNATTVVVRNITLRNALTDAVIFKLRLMRSMLLFLPISRKSPALPVVRMKVVKFPHLPVLRGLQLYLQLAHLLWLIGLQLQGLPDQRRCLHLPPQKLLTSSNRIKFQEISSSNSLTPVRTLPKLFHGDCRGLGGR
mmetsp:Transcript_38903/g.67331  ORF Transcript_38903/g.67331 Transcript_38903/m.67331 type:complete len:228 (-) Transcript_38903:82-765(-)